MSLLYSWIRGTLGKSDIYAWLRGQYGTGHLTDRDLLHVATLIHHIYRWRQGHKPPGALGRFLRAVMENDLAEAAGAADDINRKALWLYPLYMYNNAPSDWKTWIQEAQQEAERDESIQL